MFIENNIKKKKREEVIIMFVKCNFSKNKVFSLLFLTSVIHQISTKN